MSLVELLAMSQHAPSSLSSEHGLKLRDGERVARGGQSLASDNHSGLF